MKFDSSQSVDKTNFGQSLMHMIKGNLGTGILAMPASFAHCGLVNAAVGLPLLCLIATYCVHLLVRSSQHLETKLKWQNLEYAELAKGSFKSGPNWMRPYSNAMCRLVDVILLVCQFGICCVYLVFIVDNIAAILQSYNFHTPKTYLFFAIMPAALLLSYIRTLRRLAIASLCANVLQVVGISIVVDFLMRDMPSEPKVELFRPINEVALGFGSAMFAFEGISVVLPIFTRMKKQEQMGGLCGIINLSYLILLFLYFLMGLLGYMRFGNAAAGSITLNLPKEPLYDVVRAIFTISLFLTYPLQFYVPFEIVWNWASAKLAYRHQCHLKQRQLYNQNIFTAEMKSQHKQPVANNFPSSSTLSLKAMAPSDSPSSTNSPGAAAELANGTTVPLNNKQYLMYEYCCRTTLVLLTFVLALSVPKLNLMMDFFGSISGTALSITFPPLIHLATFWEDTSGSSRVIMTVLDCLIILIGLVASANGSYFSMVEIINSFHHDALAVATH